MIVESAVYCGGWVHHHCSSSLKWTWGLPADLEFSALRQHNTMFSYCDVLPQPTVAAHGVCTAVEVPRNYVASTSVAIMETVSWCLVGLGCSYAPAGVVAVSGATDTVRCLMVVEEDKACHTLLVLDLEYQDGRRRCLFAGPRH
jgi:hypothetical protein